MDNLSCGQTLILKGVALMKNTNPMLLTVLSKFNNQEKMKIKDFLLSEIDDDNLNETIAFVKSNDLEKSDKFKDILYEGEDYEGFNIEGNQYLISSKEDNVLVIDSVSEANGVPKNECRLSFYIGDFIELIQNKQEVVKLIDNLM